MQASTNEKRENRMGTMPTGRLLISMSTPMVISMLVQALYNIIDSIFVARISENALAAVSLAFPVQMLMIAVCTGTGVGINALLSRALGQQNRYDAQAAACNGIFLAVSGSAVFALFGIFGSEIFFKIQTSNQEIIRYGSDYLSIVCIYSTGIFLSITFERIMQSTGKTIYNMITQGTGAIINIILDPVLIFGMFGMPKLGIAGAAAATVIGQAASMLFSMYFNIKKNEEVSISMRGFRPDMRIIGTIYSVGIPSIIMQAISSVMVLGFNQILIRFSETAVTVLGIYFKLQSFIFMPVFGLNNGMIPVIAYNYGAGRRDRILSTVRYAMISATAIMFIGIAMFELIPGRLLLLFDASEQLLTVGIPALRIIALSFSLAGFNIVASSLYQALGNGMYSLYVSALRQLIVILPLAYLLSSIAGLHAVWYSFPLAEIASLILNIYLISNILRKKVNIL